MNHNIKRLPDAELDVMKVLWASPGPLTRPQLEAGLTERQWASTTLLALLSRLEAKGFIAREKQGRGYLYSASVPRRDYLPVESRSALGRMFEGSAKNLIAAMAETEALSEKDLDELAAFLAHLKANNAQED